MIADVIVAGAGPAGCALAARLASAGLDVVLCEKSELPRDRLCGEFVSPEALESLDALGLADRVAAAAPSRIDRLRITAPGGGVLERRLPQAAAGFTRRQLDGMLAAHAWSCGARLVQGCRVAAARRDGEGFDVDALVDGEPVAWRAGAFVDATGRGGLGPSRIPSPHVAFQAHRETLDGRGPDDAVELHAFRGGYCGLSLVEDGRVNVCVLASRQRLRESGSADTLLEGAAAENAILAERLAALAPGGRGGGWRSMSDLDLVARRPAGPYPRLGDAAASIAPLCGDGIAMALRGAELAAPLLLAHAGGRLAWEDLLDGHEAAWAGEFRRRLAIGRLVHGTLVRPGLARAGLALGRLLPAAVDGLVRATRGSVPT